MSSFIIQCNWTRLCVCVSIFGFTTKAPRAESCQYCQSSRSLITQLTEKWSDFNNVPAKYSKVNIKTNSNYVGAGVSVRASVYTKLSWNFIFLKKRQRASYLWSCIVRISKLRERHCCFFCYHQQYSSPLIDCNQFWFKSAVLHTFPRTAFRSIIDDFTHRRETLGWHQLQIVLYEWIIPTRRTR